MKGSGEGDFCLAPLRDGEAGDLAAMAREIWPAVYDPILPPGQVEFMLGWMYDPGKIRQELASGVDYRWIERGGERLGFLAFGPASPAEPCHLHKLYLRAPARGRGAGAAALGLLFGELAAFGPTAVEPRVNRHNHPAIAFYRKQGFVVHAGHCLAIGEGFVMDDLVMRRELP